MSDPSESPLDLRHRAGRYITQATGYRAFFPAPLPPVPPIRLAGDLQTQLSVADRALGRLDGSIQTLPNPDLFVFMYVRKEAVAFFLRGVASVSHEAADTARRILVLREEHRAAVTAHLGRAAGNGHRVLESLYRRPIVSVAEVQELTGTTFTAANNLVARLAKLGILQEATGYRRNRVFRYAPYIAIFGDHPPTTPSALEGDQP